jgi:hypothetical protein
MRRRSDREVGVKTGSARYRRFIATLLASALLALGASSTALAGTGSIARITFAVNCANAEIPACAAEPYGIRYTVDLHADGTADVNGSFSSRNPGSGTGGGLPIHGTISYTITVGPNGLTMGGDPNDTYYNIDVGNGVLSFPVTPGHFNAHFVSGVQIESTVIAY